MPASKPHRGEIVGRPDGGTIVGRDLTDGLGFKPKPKSSAAANRDGTWRSRRSFNGEAGLKITMRAEKGITDDKVLKVPFRFQVPVMGDFSRPYRFNWSTYDTLRLGQRPRPQGRQLLELSIDTLLLDVAATAGSTGVVVWDGTADPQKMLTELRWIMGDLPGSEAQVFRLTVSQDAVWGPHMLVNGLAALTALTPTQKSQEVGSEYVSATFLEIPDDLAVGQKQRPTKKGPASHRLADGDTLYEIAKNSQLRRASAWRQVADANGIKGVSPGDADELKAWAKRHHKKTLKIPAAK